MNCKLLFLITLLYNIPLSPSQKRKEFTRRSITSQFFQVVSGDAGHFQRLILRGCCGHPPLSSDDDSNSTSSSSDDETNGNAHHAFRQSAQQQYISMLLLRHHSPFLAITDGTQRPPQHFATSTTTQGNSQSIVTEINDNSDNDDNINLASKQQESLPVAQSSTPSLTEQKLQNNDNTPSHSRAISKSNSVSSTDKADQVSTRTQPLQPTSTAGMGKKKSSIDLEQYDTLIEQDDAKAKQERLRAEAEQLLATAGQLQTQADAVASSSHQKTWWRLW